MKCLFTIMLLLPGVLAAQAKPHAMTRSECEARGVQYLNDVNEKNPAILTSRGDQLMVSGLDILDAAAKKGTISPKDRREAELFFEAWQLIYARVPRPLPPLTDTEYARAF